MQNLTDQSVKITMQRQRKPGHKKGRFKIDIRRQQSYSNRNYSMYYEK